MSDALILVTVIITALGWWLSTLGIPTVPLALIAVGVIALSAHLLGTLDRAVYSMLNQINERIT